MPPPRDCSFCFESFRWTPANRIVTQGERRISLCDKCKALGVAREDPLAVRISSSLVAQIMQCLGEDDVDISYNDLCAFLQDNATKISDDDPETT